LIARAMRAGGAVKANAAVKRKPHVDLVCEVCGHGWHLAPSQAKGRRTCSRKCADQLKRVEAFQRATRTGPDNPNFKHGRRSGVRSREAERQWKTALRRRCQNPECGDGSGKLQIHHVVYEQHVKHEGGNRFDPRNGMTLCQSCHGSHHGRSRVIPVSALSDGALEFATELFDGDAFTAALYLYRRYRGDDPRVAAMLKSSC
jgi:5-methylcytosine-specific restriction endonuclease McrA